MRNKIFIGIAFLVCLSGCAFFKQAQQDYALGKATPYAENETTVQQQTQALTGTVSAIPYVNLATPVVAIGAPFILFWIRGRKIRKQKNDPALTAKSTFGATETIKFLSDVQKGIFEVGADGSALKRGWKMTILASLGVALAPIIHNSLIPFIASNHPSWMNGAILSLFIGVLASAEKALSKLQVPSESPSASKPQ